MPLEELEIHLREDIVLQIKSGLNEQRAFEIAVCQIGQAGVLKKEFKKVHAESWNHSLAIAAWAAFCDFIFPAFVFSWQFFRWGWVFVGLPMCCLPKTRSGHKHGMAIGHIIHLELLTLANLLMLASPVLFFWIPRASLSLKWFRHASLAALLLVWSFVLLLLLPRRRK